MTDSHATILIVDDIEDNRDIIARRLKHGNYNLITACDGEEALALLGENSVDLVLLDIMMPKKSGYDVLKEMREDPKLRPIPVVVISAVTELDSVVTCIELGADDYLTKPFNSVLLKARVTACLEKKAWQDERSEYLSRIEKEKARSDELLHVIFPNSIVEELKETNTVVARRHEGVAVLFADITGFTAYCDERNPEEVLMNLQVIVTEFERLSAAHDLLKIKTIGDGYMATSGLLEPRSNPVKNAAKCGLEMIRYAQSLQSNWDLRIGIHIGPVVAGVVGHRQYCFDIWGDTVNMAARIEAHGRAGHVNLSEEAWREVEGLYEATALGKISLKGKGEQEIFSVAPSALKDQ